MWATASCARLLSTLSSRVLVPKSYLKFLVHRTFVPVHRILHSLLSQHVSSDEKLLASRAFWICSRIAFLAQNRWNFSACKIWNLERSRISTGLLQSLYFVCRSLIMPVLVSSFSFLLLKNPILSIYICLFFACFFFCFYGVSCVIQAVLWVIQAVSWVIQAVLWVIQAVSWVIQAVLWVIQAVSWVIQAVFELSSYCVSYPRCFMCYPSCFVSYPSCSWVIQAVRELSKLLCDSRIVVLHKIPSWKKPPIAIWAFGAFLRYIRHMGTLSH